MEPTSTQSMEAILAAQTKALAEFRTAVGDDLTAKLSTLQDGVRKEVADTIKTVGDAVDVLQKRIEKTEKAIAARQRAGVSGLDDELKAEPINLLKAIPGMPAYKSDSRDAEIVREYTAKQRDLSAGKDSEGGVLIGTQMLPGFLEKLRESVKFFLPNVVTVHDNLTGTVVEIPKEVGTASVYWLGENEAPTKSDVTFAQIALTPKRAGSQVRISNRLLRLASLAAQEIVNNSMFRSLGLEMDAVILRGSGAEGKPRGITNTPGIVTVPIGTNGGDFTFAVSQALIVELETAFGLGLGTPAFASHPRAFSKMKRERILQYSGDTLGAYVSLPMSDANMREFLGYDFIKSTLFPTNLTKAAGVSLTEVILAVFKSVHVGLWENIEIKASNVTGDSTGSAMLKNQTWIMAQLEADVQISYPEAIAICTDANTI